MSGFYGANTDQLRDHAQLMVQNARRMVELRDSLSPMVLDESVWIGPDAEAFRETWSGRVASLFDQGEQLITRGRTDLDQHAEEQDTASGVGGEGGTDGGGGFNPFGFLKDMLVKGQSIYKNFQNMMDFARRIPTAFSEFMKLKGAGLETLWKASYLDELFKGGKGWQSAAEKLLDKLKIPNSLGSFRPLEHLNKLDDVAPWLKSLGGGIGKVLPAVDIVTGGIRAFNGFRDGDVYGGISGSLSALGGGLLVAAPFTGPAAPILGAVGAGLGIVSAGMDIGRMVYDNWDGITSTVGNAVSTAGDAIGNVASAAGEAIGNAGEAIGNVASDIGSSVSDAIGGLGEAFGF